MTDFDTLIANAADELTSIDSDITELRAQRKTAATRIAQLIERRKVIARIVRAATPRSHDGDHGTE